MEPHLITDIVDALEALPAIELEVKREHRPPVVFHVVCGTVFGARFKVRGVRDQDGLWIEVWEVGRVAGE